MTIVPISGLPRAPKDCKACRRARWREAAEESDEEEETKPSEPYNPTWFDRLVDWLLDGPEDQPPEQQSLNPEPKLKLAVPNPSNILSFEDVS